MKAIIKHPSVPKWLCIFVQVEVRGDGEATWCYGELQSITISNVSYRGSCTLYGCYEDFDSLTPYLLPNSSCVVDSSGNTDFELMYKIAKKFFSEHSFF